MTTNEWAAGAAYVDGQFMALKDARLPVTEWGYRRSDVTYDVTSVFYSKFFRLQDHVRRFRASMDKLRLNPKESNEDIEQILQKLVGLTGLTEAYVAMDCVRSRPPRDKPLHPIHGRAYLICHVMPWVWVFNPEQQARGIRAWISSIERIAPESIDPTVKNFHWGDLTRANFEAYDNGAETAILLDRQGNITEGPGFNVFSIKDGIVITPRAGVLEGITRRSVLELCEEQRIPTEVRDVSRSEFELSDEVFLSTTAGGVMPIGSLNGRPLGNGGPGPLSSRLRELYWRKREQGWHGTPVQYL